MNKAASKRKILVGVAWPYVNGTLHIGHLAGYLLPADICARYHRAIGDEVLMVSGSDCFGTPITVEADKRGVSPEAVVEEYHTKDLNLFTNTLKLSYDLYTKTDTPNHIAATQEIFLKMLADGYIFIDSTEQYFSPAENRFLPDRYVVGECGFCGFKDARSDQCDNCGKLLSQETLKNPRSNLTGDVVEVRKTEHYFVDWAKLGAFLKEYVGRVSWGWKEWVKKETEGWLAEGLKPRAITRDLDWGVPIPVDRMPADKVIEGVEHKRIYVWFDAVVGYLSASKEWAQLNSKSWEEFWHDRAGEELKHYYFMGKDNLVFHTLFWPGQLHAYDEALHLPDVVSINMFLNLEGKQFSKSRGVVVDVEEIVKNFGNDAVRFYLTLIMPETRDSSFTWTDFEEKVNGVLVDTFSNFVHRVLSIAKSESIDAFKNVSGSEEVSKMLEDVFIQSSEKLEKCEFRSYLDEVLNLAQHGNKLVNETELWNLKEKDKEKYHTTLLDLLLIIVGLGFLLSPLLPETSEKLLGMFGIEDNNWPTGGFAEATKKALLGSKLPSSPEPLFKKISTV